MSLINKLKYFINSTRQNVYSSRRKKKLYREITDDRYDHLKVEIALKKKWYGNSYGGFFVATDYLNSESVVYSIGIGKDISFDKKCIRNHGCEVFAYDPTPKSINWIASIDVSSRFYFFPYGITHGDSCKASFYLPNNPNGVSGSMVQNDNFDMSNSIEVEMKNIDDMGASNGHSHIDLLKMDIEGSEYETLESILDSPIRIGQILVEFHDRLFDLKPNVRSKSIVERMKSKGYVIYGASISLEEISFIHKDLIER